MTEGDRALWMSFGSTSAQAETYRSGPRSMIRRLLRISKDPTASGQPLPVLHHLQSMEVLPGDQRELPMFQAASSASCPGTGNHWKELSSIFFSYLHLKALYISSDTHDFIQFSWLNVTEITVTLQFPYLPSGFFHNGHHTSMFHTDGFTNINFLSHFPHFWEVKITLTGKEQRNCKVKNKWKSKIRPFNIQFEFEILGLHAYIQKVFLVWFSTAAPSYFKT